MWPGIIVAIALLLLTPILFMTGRVLVSMKSVTSSLDAFEQDPGPATFTDKWLLGWQIGLQRRITRWLIKGFGDRFISFYYRSAGWLFLALLLVLWIMVFLQYFAYPK